MDGLVLAGPQIPSETLKRAAGSVPVVFVAHRLRSRTVNSIATDDILGAEMVVEHLVRLGHRRIGHITVIDSRAADDRRRGYERAMVRAGLTPTVVEGGFDEEAGQIAASTLLRAPGDPTAIFAPNDLAAIGAINAVEDRGLVVPADLSVVGYDDIALAGMRHISLTTIRQPRRALGENAVRILLAHFDRRHASAQHILLEPELVIRATTAPPSAMASG